MKTNDLEGYIKSYLKAKSRKMEKYMNIPSEMVLPTHATQILKELQRKGMIEVQKDNKKPEKVVFMLIIKIIRITLIK